MYRTKQRILCIFSALFFFPFLLLQTTALQAESLGFLKRNQIITNLADALINHLPSCFERQNTRTSSSEIKILKGVSAPFDGDEWDVGKGERYVCMQQPFHLLAVIHILVPFEPSKLTFDTVKLKARGVRIIAQEDKLFGDPGILLRVMQSAHGTNFYKLMAIIGDSTQTVVISASCPEQDAPDCIENSFKRSVYFAKLIPKAPVVEAKPEPKKH